MRDYTDTTIRSLTDAEVILEKNEAKEQFNCNVFQSDLVWARSQQLNISRIIRFKLHDWLMELKAKMEVEARGISH